MGPASCRQLLKVQNHSATLGSDCNRVLSHCQSQSSKVLAALCHVIEYVSMYELCTKDMNISLFYLMNVYLYVFVYMQYGKYGIVINRPWNNVLYVHFSPPQESWFGNLMHSRVSTSQTPHEPRKLNSSESAQPSLDCLSRKRHVGMNQKSVSTVSTRQSL